MNFTQARGKAVLDFAVHWLSSLWSFPVDSGLVSFHKHMGQYHQMSVLDHSKCCRTVAINADG